MGSSSFALFAPKAGDNQYGNYGTGMPGVVPAAPAGSGVGANPTSTYGYGGSNTVGGTVKQGSTGFTTLSNTDPALTSDFFNFLSTQIGQGASPFNLSSYLPSTGGATAPGQLTAPLTPVLQQLSDFYQGKATSLPGASTLSSMAATGNPVDQTPAWQAAVAASQRNTDQNAAQLREQFASLGNLKGSPFGTAIGDFYTQTAKDQNAALLSATATSQENAANRALSASGTINSGAANIGQLLQGMDQQSINSMLQEFIRTRPEYSPYLNLLYGAATSSPQYAQTGQGGGVLGALAGLAGTAIGAVGGPIGSAVGSAVGKKIAG